VSEPHAADWLVAAERTGCVIQRVMNPTLPNSVLIDSRIPKQAYSRRQPQARFPLFLSRRAISHCLVFSIPKGNFSVFYSLLANKKLAIGIHAKLLKTNLEKVFYPFQVTTVETLADRLGFQPVPRFLRAGFQTKGKFYYGKCKHELMYHFIANERSNMHGDVFFPGPKEISDVNPNRR
jgi:hypothetical protein